jgi:hypothetical protein
MPAYRTAFQGYSVRFSPFEEGKLAVATSQNFGIIGNGKQYVLQVIRVVVALDYSVKTLKNIHHYN